MPNSKGVKLTVKECTELWLGPYHIDILTPFVYSHGELGFFFVPHMHINHRELQDVSNRKWSLE